MAVPTAPLDAPVPTHRRARGYPVGRPDSDSKAEHQLLDGSRLILRPGFVVELRELT